MKPPDSASSEREAVDAVREHRDALEDLVTTELPVARWAKHLLGLLDENNDDGRGGGER